VPRQGDVDGGERASATLEALIHPGESVNSGYHSKMQQDPDRRGGAGSAPRFLFDAVLRPNRSLGHREFRVMMIVVSIVSLVVGGAFLFAGAWPVFGFFGVDVLLLYWAFRASYRSGQAYETLQLTPDALIVRRVGPDGAPAGEWVFQPGWLKIRIDRPPTDRSQLVLSSHGRSLAVGTFLTPGERVEVADALEAALLGCRKARSPA